MKVTGGLRGHVACVVVGLEGLEGVDQWAGAAPGMGQWCEDGLVADFRAWAMSPVCPKQVSGELPELVAGRRQRMAREVGRAEPCGFAPARQMLEASTAAKHSGGRCAEVTNVTTRRHLEPKEDRLSRGVCLLSPHDVADLDEQHFERWRRLQDERRFRVEQLGALAAEPPCGPRH